MAVITTHLAATAEQIRAYKPGRDTRAATDLVEMCFVDTLDPDGRSYLQQLHNSAYRSSFLERISPFEPVSLPRTGFVWEEDGRLAGYLSLIPFFHQFQSYYLIANVAVHPDFRGRGIGRALTRRALTHARKHRVRAAWLQVRQDNGPATHIYRTEGFIERARRTTWLSGLPIENKTKERTDGIVIRSRQTKDWQLQQKWLKQLYPPELAWHLPIDQYAIRPGLSGSLYRLFNLVSPRFWVACQKDTLLGVLCQIRDSGYADTLLLAAPAEDDSHRQNAAIQSLLKRVQRDNTRKRHLSLNLPADLWTEILINCGFYPQQTLLWMEYKI